MLFTDKNGKVFYREKFTSQIKEVLDKQTSAALYKPEMFSLPFGVRGSKGRPQIWKNSLMSPLAQQYLHPIISPQNSFALVSDPWLLVCCWHSL